MTSSRNRLIRRGCWQSLPVCRARRNLHRQRARGPVTPEDERDYYGPMFDLARLEMLVGVLSAEDLRDFVDLYLEHSVTCAGRIASLAAEGDYGALGCEVHQLVGSAGNAGAQETYRLAKALDTAAKAGDQAACRRLALLLPPATARAASCCGPGWRIRGKAHGNCWNYSAIACGRRPEQVNHATKPTRAARDWVNVTRSLASLPQRRHPDQALERDRLRLTSTSN